MICWLQQEDGEGRFNSKFFRNDEDEDKLIVYANSDSPDFMECAEKCVDAFNSLSGSVINEICQKLINCAQEGNGLDEEFELPALDSPLDVLSYCWFVALYVDMESKDDEAAYAVEGEGEWGENIGFFIKNDSVAYVGTDYLDYMENAR
ncbi:hypothetical protein D1159_15005 [Pseudoflavonifractor sp. 524-17]|uniref:DUF6985 domain-containing protein n=1 Tax=Pseudoflavonifractor sp. 524-17 TaxID=2304577 RepID=UPI00137AD31C|nr:hypothetical protein [Pseudoflavonifractor sp. 524-17]NCE65849.1 hypothetical protein [Pseudoflavonifractor sp. 524-17]